MVKSKDARHAPEAPKKVRCEVCLKELPQADALMYETEDYVFWFCGSDCYDEWHKDHHKNEVGEGEVSA